MISGIPWPEQYGACCCGRGTVLSFGGAVWRRAKARRGSLGIGGSSWGRLAQLSQPVWCCLSTARCRACNCRHGEWCWQRPARYSQPIGWLSLAAGAIAPAEGGARRGPERPCGDAETSLGLVQSIDCTVPGLPAGECGLCGISTWRSGEMSLCPERPMCRGRHAARRAWRWESVSPPSRPCPLIPRLLVRKLGFWRPALPAPRVPCPDPRCPGTVQEPRASSRHGRPRNGLGHAPTRKSAEPAASVACLQ